MCLALFTYIFKATSVAKGLLTKNFQRLTNSFLQVINKVNIFSRQGHNLPFVSGFVKKYKHVTLHANDL